MESKKKKRKKKKKKMMKKMKKERKRKERQFNNKTEAEAKTTQAAAYLARAFLLGALPMRSSWLSRDLFISLVAFPER
jgi:hypothetical protein